MDQTLALSFFVHFATSAGSGRPRRVDLLSGGSCAGMIAARQQHDQAVLAKLGVLSSGCMNEHHGRFHKVFESRNSPYFSLCRCELGSDRAPWTAMTHEDVVAVAAAWRNSIDQIEGEDEGLVQSMEEELNEYVSFHAARLSSDDGLSSAYGL